MDSIKNITKNILPEGAQPGAGLCELINLFSDMSIPEEVITRMIECLRGKSAEEIDRTASSLIKHFKKQGSRES